VLWSHLWDTLIRKKIDERKNYISMVLHLLTKLLLGNTKFLGGMENLQEWKVSLRNNYFARELCLGERKHFSSERNVFQRNAKLVSKHNFLERNTNLEQTCV